MSENHLRCRYFPECVIHTGDPRPRHLSADNAADIREMFENGSSIVNISRVFEVTPQSISDIVNGRAHRV